MLVLDQCLTEKQNVLIEGGTIFKNIYGCAKQYRCATGLHLISLFCAKTNVCVDRLIGAPGYGIDIADGIDLCDK